MSLQGRDVALKYHFSDIDISLWFFFTIWLVVDSLTGFLGFIGITFPLSQIFKSTVLILLLLAISKNRRLLGVVFFCISYISLLIVIHGVFSLNIKTTVTHLTKLISSILLYLYFSDTIILYQNSVLLKIRKVIIIGFFVVVFNLSLGFFKIGINTYVNEGLGYKGFFFAGNELGGVFACIVPFILYLIFTRKSLRFYVISSIYILILAFILSTKSVIIISLFSIFVVPWLYGNKKVRKNTVIVLLCVGLPILLFSGHVMFMEEKGLMVKYIYSYNRNGVIGLLMSGRDVFWETQQMEFNNLDFLRQFFGQGGGITVEMDFFDSLLNYGYFGAFINISIYILLLVNAYTNKKNNDYIKLLIIQDWMLILMSCIAGHILYSSMAGLYIALINSLVYVKSKNICVKKEY